MKEIWKDIPGYEGRYKASNLGRIKSMNYLGHEGNEQILKPNIGKHYYNRIQLLDKIYLLHRVIAMTFLPEYNEELTIDHINNNPNDNRLENLRVCTQKENVNNTNSNIIKPVRIYFKNNEIKEFKSAYEADQYLGAPLTTISTRIRRKQGSKKYNFKKVEYI